MTAVPEVVELSDDGHELLGFIPGESAGLSAAALGVDRVPGMVDEMRVDCSFTV